MKRCPIAAKIAGYIGILPCRAVPCRAVPCLALNQFCEASLIATIICIYGKFGPHAYNASRISLLAKRWPAPILKLTDDQKMDFIFGLTWTDILGQIYVRVTNITSQTLSPCNFYMPLRVDLILAGNNP